MGHDKTIRVSAASVKLVDVGRDHPKGQTINFEKQKLMMCNICSYVGPVGLTGVDYRKQLSRAREAHRDEDHVGRQVNKPAAPALETDLEGVPERKENAQSEMVEGPPLKRGKPEVDASGVRSSIRASETYRTESRQTVCTQGEVITKFFPDGGVQEITERGPTVTTTEKIETREKKLEMELEEVKRELAQEKDNFNHLTHRHRELSKKMCYDEKYTSFILTRTLKLTREALKALVEEKKLDAWMEHVGKYPAMYGNWSPPDESTYEEILKSKHPFEFICPELFLAGWTTAELKKMVLYHLG